MITEIDKLNLLLAAMGCELSGLSINDDSDPSDEDVARAVRKSLIRLRRTFAKEAVDVLGEDDRRYFPLSVGSDVQ